MNGVWKTQETSKRSMHMYVCSVRADWEFSSKERENYSPINVTILKIRINEIAGIVIMCK